jgi:hypothetical protein
MYTNFSTQYPSIVKEAIAPYPSFRAICQLNEEHFPKNGYQLYYPSLQHGTAILHTHEQLNAYLASYGEMHRLKLQDAYRRLFADTSLCGKRVHVIDWGCGQALASCVLIDFIRENHVPIDIDKIVLIEPSAAALKRGVHHLQALHSSHPMPQIDCINRKADDLTTEDVETQSKAVKIHLFSNLLDMNSLKIDEVVATVKQSQPGLNYFVCVSPANGFRLAQFFRRFNAAELISARSDQFVAQIFGVIAARRIFRSIFRIEYIFKVNL